MERWKIWSVIGIMSFALIGVAMSQIYWIKWSISLDEKNFTSKVFRALNEVRSEIDLEVKNLDIGFSENLINSTEDSGKNTDWRKSQILKETKSLEYSLDPEAHLNKLSSNKINKYIIKALRQQGIELDFTYGIFSKIKDDFLIVEDRFFENEEKISESVLQGNNSELRETKYKVSLLSTEFKSPGTLNLLFIESIWSNILPTLLLNLIFTILILFVFSYTVFIIFKQKKISQMKTDFVDNMTHEFKTPIATISLATDSILTPVIFNDKEKIRKFINIIKEENDRLLSQVENVLQIAKLDKRKIELSLTEIDVHEILDKTIQYLQLKLEKKEGKIVKQYSAKLSLIEADETHILNIFSNIIENAMKYSLGKPLITVKTYDFHDGIEILISDNGIGMSNEELNHIFDKFYRVSTGNVHNIKGFGLGLAYVKTFVESHKAKILVKSEKDKGSEFIIRFKKHVT